MIPKFAPHGAFIGVVLIAVTVLAVPLPARQAHGARERFTAFAVDIGSPGRGSAGPVEIVIDRYSTDAERDRLLTALIEKGPDRLLETLQKLPRLGYIRTPNSIGYDLHYARKHAAEGGGEEISVMTDRYITFWEAAYRPRTIDYPFTLIELHVGPDGKGEGKMSMATSIVYDKSKNTIVLEDYKSQPALLTNLRREAASE